MAGEMSVGFDGVDVRVCTFVRYSIRCFIPSFNSPPVSVGTFPGYRWERDWRRSKGKRIG